MVMSGGGHVSREKLRNLTGMFCCIAALHRDPRAKRAAGEAARRFGALGARRNFVQSVLFDYGVSREECAGVILDSLLACGGAGALRSVAPLCRRISGGTEVGKSFWGPRIWAMLHHYANLASGPNASPENSLHLFRIVLSAGALLPCGECREHAAAYARTHGLREMLAQREAPAQWMLRFHNSVNSRLGKSPFPDSQ